MVAVIRRLLRLFRRRLPRPNPAPPPSGPSPSNPDGGTGIVDLGAIPENVCNIPEGYTYIHVEWGEVPTATYGWVHDHNEPAVASCHVEVVKPTELDAIAARFDARIDAVLRARSSKEVPGVMKPGDAG